MPQGVGNIPGQGLRDFTELVRGFGRLSTFTPIAPRMADSVRVAPTDTKSPESRPRSSSPDGIVRLSHPQVGRNLDFLA